MIKVKQYQDKLQKIQGENISESFKMICKTYQRMLERKNYSDFSKLISEFKSDIISESLEDSDLNLFHKYFSELRVYDMGVNESLSKILDDSQPVFDEDVRSIVEKLQSSVKDKPDYMVIEKVIRSLKSLPNDEVIKESIELLENNLQANQDDVRVLNMIEYLENNTDKNKGTSIYNKCIESLKVYNSQPNTPNRINAQECLKNLGYDSIVKEFLNYLTTLTLSADDYNHNTHIDGSLAQGRVMSGGYLEKYHTGEESVGLGKIVIESLEDAMSIANDVPKRTVYRLLIERLNNAKKDLNDADLKVLEKIQRDAVVYNLGIVESLETIKHKSVFGQTPAFKDVEKFVNENINAGKTDMEFINQYYNMLSKFDYDKVVESECKKLKDIYAKYNDIILVHEALNYIKHNNKLNLNSKLEEDLKDYLESPSNYKRKSIVENNKETTLDGNLLNFLNSFNTIQNTNGIVNSNPKDFSIENVYGFIQTNLSEGKLNEYMIIDNRYYHKVGNDLKVVKESKMPNKILELNYIFNSYNFELVNESTFRGFSGTDKIEIKINEAGIPNLYINNEMLKSNIEQDVLEYVAKNMKSNINFKSLFHLVENIDTFVKFDFANIVRYKRDPKIYFNLMKIDESFYINYINEHIELNKYAKTNKFTTLRNQLYEFMEFDITQSFLPQIINETNDINELKEKARIKNNEINECVNKLQHLEMDVENIKDELMKTDAYSIIEGFKDELQKDKDEYRRLIEQISDMESSATILGAI